MSEDATALETEAIEDALAIVATLAGAIGARRPTSRAERVAAEVVRDALGSAGIQSTVEPFPAHPSFGYPFGAIAALASAPALLPRRRRTARGRSSRSRSRVSRPGKGSTPCPAAAR